MTVHQRLLKLILEIASRAQPTDGHMCAYKLRKLHGQSVEGFDAHMREAFLSNCLVPQGYTFLSSEEQPLTWLGIYTDHELVHKLASPVRDVEVPSMDRIERAGID